MNNPRPVAAALLGAALVAFGCATPERHPITAYHQYDYEYAVKGLRKMAAEIKAKDERNIVLMNISYAGAGFAGGDYRTAAEGLTTAAQIMDNVEYGTERGQAAMALAQDMRVFKGEPYERALAYTYLGLTYYRRGDFENARSAFNLALLADRSSKGENEAYREDFTLAHYLIGRTYLRLGEADNAEISFKKVAQYQSDNPFPDPVKLKDKNATFLVELGCGPKKSPDPVVGSVDVIVPCQYPERYAEIYLNDQFLGRTARLVDMNHQAKTSGTSQRDTAQAVKGGVVAIGKHLPYIGALFSIAEAAGVNRADTRYWIMMPGEVHVLEAKVPDGVYTLQARFFDQAGQELERYRQTHYYFTVRSEVADSELQVEPVYMIRSGLDRHNVVRPKEPPYLTPFDLGLGVGHHQRRQRPF